MQLEVFYLTYPTPECDSVKLVLSSPYEKDSLHLATKTTFRKDAILHAVNEAKRFARENELEYIEHYKE